MAILGGNTQRGPVSFQSRGPSDPRAVGQEYSSGVNYPDIQRDLRNLLEEEGRGERRKINRKKNWGRLGQAASEISKLWGPSFKAFVEAAVPSYMLQGNNIFTEFLKDVWKQPNPVNIFLNLRKTSEVIRPFLGDLKAEHLSDYELKNINDSVIEFYETLENYPNQSLPHLENRQRAARNARETIKRVAESHEKDFAKSTILSRLYRHFDKICKELDPAVSFSSDRKRYKDKFDSLTSTWKERLISLKKYKDDYDAETDPTKKAAHKSNQESFRTDILTGEYENFVTNAKDRLTFLFQERQRKIEVSPADRSSIVQAYDTEVQKIVEELILKRAYVCPTNTCNAPSIVEGTYIDSGKESTFRYDLTAAPSKSLPEIII